jgi:glycosyltransferase involved in cell wall biosynthesis
MEERFMNVGVVAEAIDMQSLKYVFEGLDQSLAKRHKVSHRSMEFFYSSPRRREELHDEFVLNSDILVGRIDERVFRSRERLDRQPPMICFLLGAISRGGGELPWVHRYLKSTDVLVGNCSGDIEIAAKFFKNGQARKLPFSFDESTFHAVDESRRQALKAELGFQKSDQILLYAGRITLEKNLHTQIRMLSILQRLLPNLHLIIIGQLHNVGFREAGVYPVDIIGMFTRLLSELRLDTSRIHFLGPKSPTQTRDFYIIADALVNLTLHHDENFGFAQVEAMACGTPVIGTKWGGLKDTIKHNETGYHVSTVVTDAGVKLNWWEAINRIVQLLEDEATRQRFRERCPVHVMQHFSTQRYDEVLESIMVDCKKVSESGSQPLALSDFGAEFWKYCLAGSMSLPPLQRGGRSFELYKELIGPFTGVTESTVPMADNLQPDQLLVLATPVQTEGGIIRINDPIFPMEVSMPEDYQKTCHAILEIFKREPVVQLKRLISLLASPLVPSTDETLKWMLNAGILLRTRPMNPSLDPELIGDQMSRPLFTIQNVDYRSDVYVIKQMW